MRSPKAILIHDQAKLEKTLKELADIKFALDASSIVAITDQRGKIIYANDRFCEISKYAREELLGQDHKVVNSGHHPKDFFRDMWRTIAGGKVWKGEIRNRKKNGDHYWVDTTIVPFLNDQGKPYQYVSIRTEITQRKIMEEQIEALPQRIIQAQEHECNRIARDIHDDLGQSLATLKMLIQSAWLESPGGKEVPQEKIISYLNSIIDKSRTLATRLRPSTLDILGLPAALTMMFAEVNHSSKLKINFRHSSLKGLRFKAETINVFRIIQESVTNVLKHARATKVDVMINKTKGRLRIVIKDNGRGFAINERSGGLGLATMQERVKILGGTVEIISAAKQGTTVRFDVPIYEEKL